MKKVGTSSKTKFTPAHINMLVNTTSFALSAENIAVTQSIPAYYNAMSQLKNKMDMIRSLRGIVILNITGYAVRKAATKAELVKVTSNIMNAAYSYAVTTNNYVLADAMVISPSKLRNMSYARVLRYAGGAIQMVGPYADDGSLGDYGVTPAIVAAWQSLWDYLNSIFSDPKTAIATRVGLNANIRNLLQECMITLTNQCDTLAMQFGVANSEYYAQYIYIRRLNAHHVSTQLRCTVEDAAGNAIANAEVFILGTDRSASTAENGYCSIMQIPFGTHSVTVTTPQGNQTFGPYLFKKGQSMTKHFTITSAATETNSTPKELVNN